MFSLLAFLALMPMARGICDTECGPLSDLLSGCSLPPYSPAWDRPSSELRNLTGLPPAWSYQAGPNTYHIANYSQADCFCHDAPAEILSCFDCHGLNWDGGEMPFQDILGGMYEDCTAFGYFDNSTLSYPSTTISSMPEATQFTDSSGSDACVDLFGGAQRALFKNLNISDKCNDAHHHSGLPQASTAVDITPTYSCEWTEATWDNIVNDCNLTGDDTGVEPWRNRTALYKSASYNPRTGFQCIANRRPSDDEEDIPKWEPSWDICPSTATIPENNTQMIWEWARDNSLPMACLRSFDKELPYARRQLSGAKLCLSRTCETKIVPKLTSVVKYVEETDNLTMQ
ncbi:hypothetical protein ACRE_048070 [Hapsidospora chrysogenum ATCC 11550]|uniref:Uncharacterized protein n=1 Tax=Hapsidospora chrysogenum (strain ATCC 11550 / CBS 779.69 / DSM 880 / IAM 14645 / JCM 23072 / IMI 49137) TaxID=857340 RepID=A0A086T4U3_HAPC1|nr:hypothetical protein ACRE_048070 [Hapsidospora chrysogenum ATCC 11550]